MLEKMDRVKGGLIGIAYGDAFGMPGEMWSGETIREKMGVIREFLPGHPDNRISGGFSRGEVTDDTINSILVTEMLEENKGKADARIFIRKLQEWISHSEKSAAVVGPSTSRALRLIEEGVPMEEAGGSGVTNGAAMKIIPLGLLEGISCNEIPDSDRLIRQVVELCRPTHFTSVAISAACAIAGGAAAAVSGGKTVDQIYNYMISLAEKGSRYGNPTFGPSVSCRMRLAGYFAGQSKGEALNNISDFVGTGISSAESIPAAAAIFLVSEGDPVKCAEYAVNMGGDTDTIASMACGLCGAFLGEKAFPEKDIELLENVNGISFAALAERLLHCRTFCDQ